MTSKPSKRVYHRVIHLLYPSGHRQLWYEIKLDSPSTFLYECETFSPEGDSLEFRILSRSQLQRTINRLRRRGGKVIVRSGHSIASDPKPRQR